MASVLKVDKLDPQSGTALEIGTSGDTISVPSGATLDISASTLTPPATMPASSGVNLTALNATNLGSGTVPTARLGTGTASSSTILYGDNTWAAAAGGITTADQWRLTVGFAGDASPIASNLERVDTTAGGQSMLGDAMTESSGIFTFPSTGYWLVRFFVQWNGGEDRYLVNTIQGTIDDSAYSVIAQGTTFIQSTSGTSSMACVTESIIDVTDTSNVKVKFNAYSNLQSGSVVGTSVTNATYFTFIRLADT